MSYKLGDNVSWQNRYYDPVHAGKIVAVVYPNESPRMVANSLGLEFAMDFGLPRLEESYIVHEPSKSGKGRGKLFWPRVSALRKES